MTARPADLRGSVGTLGYYRARHADFVRRHPDLPPPDYYLGYGDRYMRRFFSETRPHLSEAGQRWLTDTRHALQEALENERARDADAFDRMECTPGALRRFCYGTHPSAYIEAGLANLDPLDWSTIVLTPDASAILTPDGLGQIVDTAGRLVVARAQADSAAVRAACPLLGPLGSAVGTMGRQVAPIVDPIVERARRDSQIVGAAVTPLLEPLGQALIPVAEPIRRGLLEAVESLSDRTRGRTSDDG